MLFSKEFLHENIAEIIGKYKMLLRKAKWFCWEFVSEIALKMQSTRLYKRDKWKGRRSGLIFICGFGWITFLSMIPPAHAGCSNSSGSTQCIVNTRMFALFYM
jgi:hypothetical protein